MSRTLMCMIEMCQFDVFLYSEWQFGM